MRKSFFSLSFAMIGALAALPVMAQTSAQFQHAGSAFEVGTGYYQETYDEEVDGAKVMQQKADMVSVFGSMRSPLTKSVSASLRGEFAFGDSAYTGSYQGGQYGDVHVTGIGRSRAEVSGNLHYHPKNMGGLEFVGGLGYRRLADDLQKAAGGYKRVNELVYLQLGLNKKFSLNPDWSMTPAVIIKSVVRGTQFAAIEGGMDFKQNSGQGLDVSVKFAKKIAGKSAVTIEPFLRTWHVKKSEERLGGAGIYFEPKNKTKEVGINVAWLF